MTSTVFAGCMTAPVLIPGDGLSLSRDHPTATFTVSFPRGADTPWQAVADESWVNIDRSAGSGTTVIGVEVDPDHSDVQSPGLYTANIDVNTANGSATIVVTYEVPVSRPDTFSDAGALSTPYFPIATRNLWSFRMPRPGLDPFIAPAFPYRLTIEVADIFSVGEFTVAELAVSALYPAAALSTFLTDDPLLATGINLFTNHLTSIEVSTSFYVTSADGVYVVTSRRSDTEALPERGEFTPLSDLLQTPGRVVEALHSNAFEDFQEDVLGELSRIRLEFGPNGLGPDIDRALSDPALTDNIAALGAAVSAEFDSYNGSDTESANAFARLLATLAPGLVDVVIFGQRIDEILSGEFQDLLILGTELDQYIRTEESVDASIILLRTLADELDALQTSDRLSSHVGETIRLIALGVADVVEAINSDRYSLNDADVVELNDAIYGLLYTDFAAGEDVLVLIQNLTELINAHEPAGPGSEELLAFYADVLTELTLTADYLTSGFLHSTGSLEGLAELTVFLAEFFDDHAMDNPGNVLSRYLELALRLTFEAVDAVVAIEPFSREIESELSAFLESLSVSELINPSFSAYAVVLDELAAWLDDWAASNGDVFAEAAAIVLAGASDLAEAIDRFLDAGANATFAVNRGALSQFLPSHVTDNFTVTVEDVLFGFDLPDVEALELVSNPENDSDSRDSLPVAIFARDIGPVLVGSVLVLDAAVVDGVTLDPDISQE